MRSAAARQAEPPARHTSRLAMAGALAVLGLLALDLAAVPAVLPSVRVDLGSSSSGLVWVQGAYLLTLGVVVLLLAQLDLDGRVLAAAGLAAFLGGSLLASTADSTATLVTGRAVQGAGAAAMLVPALATLHASGREARLLVATVPGAALFALAVAPLAGGAVAEGSAWRWLFRIELAASVPAVLLLAAGGRSAARRADTRRTAALAAGLILSVTALIQSGPWGWGSADTLLLLAAGAALIAFGRPAAPAGADAAVLALSGCLAVALLLAPQYLELVRGLSPLRSGLLTTVLTLSAAALAAAAALLGGEGRVRPRLSMVGGLACATLGALGMTRIDPASSYALVIVSLGLLGGGIGAAGRALAHRTEGLRLAAAAAPGAALVVAAAGALLERGQLEERQDGGSFEDALAAGLAASGWLMAALLVVAAVLAWRRGSGRAAR